MMKDKVKQVLVRLPEDVINWVEVQNVENCSSKSSEIVRALREKMARIPDRISSASAGN